MEMAKEIVDKKYGSFSRLERGNRETKIRDLRNL